MIVRIRTTEVGRYPPLGGVYMPVVYSFTNGVAKKRYTWTVYCEL